MKVVVNCKLLMVNEAPVDELKFALGLQVYVEAPLAFIGEGVPAQIEKSLVSTTVGSAFTVTFVTEVFLHPAVLVPVIV